MTDLRGKTALVTGGSAGIGAASAARLAQLGARVAITYLQNAGGAEATLRAIKTAGGEAIAMQADLTDRRQLDAVVPWMTDRFGRIDILVNNAARGGATPLDRLTLEDIDERMALNVRAPLRLIQAALPLMRAAGGGCVVNVSSVNGRTPVRDASVYSASKAALDALTRSLAAELGAFGIRVNGVAPGLTATERRMKTHTLEAEAFAAAATPLGRLGSPAEIAEVVAFLCSAEARWITGEVIGATGGYGLK